MWQQIYQSADNDWLKQDARRRLVQLDALDQIDELQEGLRRFTAATGVAPPSWTELVQRGVLRGEPRRSHRHAVRLIDATRSPWRRPRRSIRYRTNPQAYKDP